MAKSPKKLTEQRIRAWPHPGKPHRKLYYQIMRLMGEVVAEWALIEEHLAHLLARAAKWARPKPMPSATSID
jgi:hypothetical protein